MPLRVSGPDRGVKAISRRPVARRPKPKPEQGLLKRVTGSVGDVVDKLGEVPVDLRSLTTGARVRRGPKVKDVVRQGGELSGINSVRRIRAGKGNWADYVTVGASAAGPVGRITAAAARGARTARPFGVLSDDHLTRLMQRGFGEIEGPKAAAIHRALRESLQGDGRLYIPHTRHVKMPLGGRVTERFPRGSILRAPTQRLSPFERVVFPQSRLPWIVDDAADNVFVGRANDIHGNIQRTMPRGAGDWNDLGQGYLFAPGLHDAGTPFANIVPGSVDGVALRRWLKKLSTVLDINDEDVRIQTSLWDD